MSIETNSLMQRARLGMGWERLVLDSNPDYGITLTFAKPLRDRYAEESMRYFISATTRLLPRRMRPDFSGFISAERTQDGKLAGTLHFHLVTSGLNSITVNAFEWLNQSVKVVGRRMRSPSGARLILPGNILVRLIETEADQKKVSAYDTKDIYNFDRPAGSQLLTFKNGAVIGRLLD